MNEDQKLICCPTCTIKYTSYHNRCPKCGTPKPTTPNIIKEEERIEPIKEIKGNNPTPNVTIQDQTPLTVGQPTTNINTSYSNPTIFPFNHEHSEQYCHQNNNYNNYNNFSNSFNLNSINYQEETTKTIKNLYLLSNIIFIATLIIAVFLTIYYLISNTYYGLSILLVIVLIPGSILLLGLITSQTLKWKALMLYHTQNNSHYITKN